MDQTTLLKLTSAAITMASNAQTKNGWRPEVTGSVAAALIRSALEPGGGEVKAALLMYAK